MNQLKFFGHILGEIRVVTHVRVIGVSLVYSKTILFSVFLKTMQGQSEDMHEEN
jgi:hypothetical protein